MKFLWGVVVTLIFIIGGALAIIWSGAYNIAATDKHFDPVRWAFATTMHNSVELRADASAPESFTEDQVRDGFRSYDSTCVTCHGAPGVEKAEFAKGLRPSPPELGKAAKEWAPEELFWIVKNGIKMSGMPALGPTHSDADIWNIVAFVERLPDMSPKNYARFREASGGSPGSGHHGGSGSGFASDRFGQAAAASAEATQRRPSRNGAVNHHDETADQP